MQIRNVKLVRGEEIYCVKWVNIPSHLNTWEPVRHLVGERAAAALDAFKNKRKAEELQIQAEKDNAARRELADNEVEIIEPTTKRARAPGPRIPLGSTPGVRRPAAANTSSSQKRSPVWIHFTDPYILIDKKTGKHTRHADCVHCGKRFSAASTTNLKSHFNFSHRDIAVKELEDADAEGSQQYQSLDQATSGKVKPFSDPKTNSLHQTYVKW